MKILTLWQPWASLIDLNEKKIETRGWKAPDYLIGKKIGIHSARKVEDRICMSHPYWQVLIKNCALKKLKVKEYFMGYKPYEIDFPTGLILCTCTLTDCLRIVENHEDTDEPYAVLEDGRKISGNEYYFGDYTPGRWAWIFDNITSLDVPIPAKGQQRLWEFELII